jgi:SSS family solute:Na+ symporter
MPGLMANQLYADKLPTADAAFPTLITQLVPAGIRGFIYAAIAGAVTSTLASLLNSASTIATMDVYSAMIRKDAPQKTLVWLGRVLTVLFVIGGCLIAPVLDNPKYGGVFQYIQQFQGYIWPGVTAAFLGALLLPRAPGSAGVAALLLGPVAYGVLQFTTKNADRPWGHEIHFLLQVLIAFVAVAVVMILITVARPLAQPKVLPERKDLDLRSAPIVIWSGAAVIVGVIIFFIKFW